MAALARPRTHSNRGERTPLASREGRLEVTPRTFYTVHLTSGRNAALILTPCLQSRLTAPPPTEARIVAAYVETRNVAGVYSAFALL